MGNGFEQYYFIFLFAFTGIDDVDGDQGLLRI